MSNDGSRAAAISKTLNDSEREMRERREQESRDRVNHLFEAIDKLLVGNNATWQEWHDVIGLFNQRNEMVVPQIKMSEIKNRFENR